jgi:hypothetical protein
MLNKTIAIILPKITVSYNHPSIYEDLMYNLLYQTPDKFVKTQQRYMIPNSGYMKNWKLVTTGTLKRYDIMIIRSSAMLFDSREQIKISNVNDEASVYRHVSKI